MSNNLKHIQIKDSYKVWRPMTMAKLIGAMGYVISADQSILAIIIEWWLHNIVYWLTKPFIFIPAIKELNVRAKDVDLMIKVRYQ